MKKFSTFISELNNPQQIKQFKDKVSHIDNVDARDTSWQYTLPELMSEFGFSRLGSGKYAVVFGHPKYDYIIKVFMKDAAYSKWLQFCLANRNNKYVPKIRGKVIKITPIFNSIRLEKLSPYKSSAASSKAFMAEYGKFKRDPSYRPDDKELADVFDHFEQNKSLLDLHGENVMMRGSQLVVIDPYYNWFKPAQKRFTIDPDDIDPSIF